MLSFPCLLNYLIYGSKSICPFYNNQSKTMQGYNEITCTAARPTPPAAAWISTRSAVVVAATPCRAAWTVTNTVGSVLPCWAPAVGGSTVRFSAEHITIHVRL